MAVAAAMTIAVAVAMTIAIVSVAATPAIATAPTIMMALAAAPPSGTVEMTRPEECGPAHPGAAICGGAARTGARSVRECRCGDQDDDCGGQYRRRASSKSIFHGDTPDTNSQIVQTVTRTTNTVPEHRG